MAITLNQSAAMVTRIASQKLSIEGSSQSAQAGEFAILKKENERMKGLVKSLDDLRISLQDENKMLKEKDKEKEEMIAKMV